jgi:hypothetical protein
LLKIQFQFEMLLVGLFFLIDKIGHFLFLLFHCFFERVLSSARIYIKYYLEDLCVFVDLGAVFVEDHGVTPNEADICFKICPVFVLIIFDRFLQ